MKICDAPRAGREAAACADQQGAGGVTVGRAWRRPAVAVALLIAVVGIGLRLLPACGVPDERSIDENLYIKDVMMVKGVGLLNYGGVVRYYVEKQSRQDFVMLPPTRFVYIALGLAWDEVFRCGPVMALRHVAAGFSVATLLLAGWFAYRLGGVRAGLVVGALMAVSPIELMLAHRELCDGVFEFWALLALWLLWENMQKPGRLGWLAVYAGAICVMTLTKENAFFAAAGLCGIQAVAALWPGLGLGKRAWSTAAATVAGGVAGVLVLVSLAGGPETLVRAYVLLVAKAEKMPFAYVSGGGPWFRYVVDLMLVSPAVMLPAIGGAFGLRREDRGGLFLLLFVVLSCAVMVNVRNGMNLRYATMWDMPLRFLAAGALVRAADGLAGWKGWRTKAAVLACMVVLAGGLELRQYAVIFVRHDIADPIPQFMMQALEITRPLQARP